MASAPPLPPGFELETAPAPRGPIQPIIPRTPPPQTAPQRAIDEGRAAAAPYDPIRAAADARKAAADAQAAEDAHRRHGLTAEQQNALQSQYNSLDLLERGISDVDALYQRDFRGRRTTIGGLLPGMVAPSNSAFNTAADSLMSAIAAAQGLTAQQQNTPAELRIRFGPMIPTSTDTDEVIEQKLGRLRDLLGTQRRTLAQQLGLREHPGDVEQANAGAVAAGAPIGAAGVVTPANGPTTPGAPPSGMTAANPGEGPRAQFIPGQGQELSQGTTPGERYTTEEDRRLFEGLAPLIQNGQSREQMQAWLSQNYPGAQITDEQWQQIDDARRNHRDMRIVPGASGVRSAVEAVARTVLHSPFGEGGDAFIANAADSASLGAPGLFSEEYRNRLGDIRTRNPGASLAGALVGGLVAPGGPRPGMSLGETMLHTGGQGGVYGLNSTGGSPEGAATGFTLGALAPAAFRLGGAGVRGAYRGLGGGRGGAEALPGAMAAQELNIPLMPGDVGGPFTRRATSVGAQLPFSTGRITRAYEATETAAQAARDRVASTVAGEGREVLGAEAAGQAATRGALEYRSGSRMAVGRAYDRAQELAGDARITPTRAIEALDRNIAELNEVPGGAPAALADLRQKLQGNFSVSGLRGLRTQLRDDFASQGLRGSDLERRAMQVVDAVTEDINTGLTQAGRADAAAAYRAADEMHRARVDTIDSVLMPIIGRRGEKSGEQVVRALQQASQGNSQRLERFISALPPEESSDVRATLIGQMGRATNGQQNAATDAFSLSTFLTNYSAMTPSARRTVFGREGTKALNQLAEVANLRRQAGRFANSSQSGAIMGSLFTWGPGILTAIGSQQAMAKLLTSPRLVRFLANMPREPGRVRQYIGRLNVMARTETNPVLAQQFRGFADALNRAANDNVPLAAAANPSDQEGQNNE